MYIDPTERNKNGTNNDPTVGVAIILSDRMVDKSVGPRTHVGHIDTRIVWVKLAEPISNIFFIVVYVPNKGK